MTRWTSLEEARALSQDRAFTPNRREIEALVALLGQVDRDTATQLGAALARAGSAAAKFARATLPTATPPLRARLIELIGRVAQHDPDPEWYATLASSARDEDEQSARKALVMLGKLAPARPLPAELESQIIGAFATAKPPLQRAIVETLGKAGSQQAVPLLRRRAGSDAELERLRARAVLMLERRVQRNEESEIAPDQRLPGPTRVALRCRPGLGRLLAQEVRAFATPVRLASDRVEIAHAGTLRSLLAARCALDVALLAPLPKGKDLRARVLAALGHAAVLPALRAWTRGAIRLRIAWASGGHRRAETWKLAQQIGEQWPELRNDPSQPCWELLIDERGAEIALIPRAFGDPRFAYRKADVPAASHPTLAAALALQAAPRASDVVWDPFVGSGLELIEVHKRQRVRELHGSDSDARALDAARANMRAAGISDVYLRVADARSQHPPRVSLIITNPPMGRRVARDGALLGLLDDFLRNARECLTPQGRVVWLSPAPLHTAETAAKLGYSVERLEEVDMGGFPAELQMLRR